jgi:hypothetical protein
MENRKETLLQRQLESLVEYVNESDGDECLLALCVLSDFALGSKSEGAKKILAKATLQHLGDSAQEVREASADFLNDALKAMKQRPDKLRAAVESGVEEQLGQEDIKRIQRKLHRVLVTIGVREATVSLKNGIKIVTALASLFSSATAA